MKTLNIIISICILQFSFYNLQSYAQLAYNDGADITIEAGLTVTIQGNHKNANNGYITNYGIIKVSGDWLNYSPNGALDPSIGTLVLNGDSQFIGGTDQSTLRDRDACISKDLFPLIFIKIHTSFPQNSFLFIPSAHPDMPTR